MKKELKAYKCKGYFKTSRAQDKPGRHFGWLNAAPNRANAGINLYLEG